MEKEKLREGLKRLDAYAEKMEFHSVFLEEGPEVELDSLVFGLEMEGDLSVDISCNFVHTEEAGSILQFYGQLELDGLREEEPDVFQEKNVLQLVNMLNKIIPVGQFLYMEKERDGENALGIRYTMLTDLGSEAELKKCVHVLQLLGDAYELLCSMILLLAEGESLESAIKVVTEVMNE